MGLVRPRPLDKQGRPLLPCPSQNCHNLAPTLPRLARRRRVQRASVTTECFGNADTGRGRQPKAGVDGTETRAASAHPSETDPTDQRPGDGTARYLRSPALQGPHAVVWRTSEVKPDRKCPCQSIPDLGNLLLRPPSASPEDGPVPAVHVPSLEGGEVRSTELRADHQKPQRAKVIVDIEAWSLSLMAFWP